MEPELRQDMINVNEAQATSANAGQPPANNNESPAAVSDQSDLLMSEEDESISRSAKSKDQSCELIDTTSRQRKREKKAQAKDAQSV